MTEKKNLVKKLRFWCIFFISGITFQQNGKPRMSFKIKDKTPGAKIISFKLLKLLSVNFAKIWHFRCFITYKNLFSERVVIWQKYHRQPSSREIVIAQIYPQVKTQHLHFRSHEEYFLLSWKIPEVISRWSILFHN